MRKVLIIGGGGMIGQKLAKSLLDAPLGAEDHVTLFDMAFPPDSPAEATQILGNLADASALRALISQRFDLVFHLAAIVSGESESDFDKGWAVNGQAFWTFTDALKSEHTASGGAYLPRIVFTSSIAVFGGPYPDQIDDDFPLAPQTSYGAQKACSEFMLADIARRGMVQGIALRLPTICVRPGKANLAASSFFSGIIREPLNGQAARLPVADSVRHWHASPRSAVGFLRHAATMDLAPLGNRIALNLPGVSCTVAEQIEALERVAGSGRVALIQRDPDPTINAIVSGWPRNFAPERALSLGFKAEMTFEDIIRVYIEDDLHAATP